MSEKCGQCCLDPRCRTWYHNFWQVVFSKTTTDFGPLWTDWHSLPMVPIVTLCIAKGKNANENGVHERMGKSLWLAQDGSDSLGWDMEVQWGASPETAFQKPRRRNAPLINGWTGNWMVTVKQTLCYSQHSPLSSLRTYFSGGTVSL